TNAFDIKNLGLITVNSGDKNKSPNSFYLPPIADALSRRGGDKTNPSGGGGSSGGNDGEDKGDKFAGLCSKLQVELSSQTESSRTSKPNKLTSPHSNNSPSSQRANDFAATSSAAAAASSSSSSVLTLAAQVKSEEHQQQQQHNNNNGGGGSSNSAVMLYDLRNFAHQFGHTLQRDSPHHDPAAADMNALLGSNGNNNGTSGSATGDCNQQSASVDLFFRSDSSQQQSANNNCSSSNTNDSSDGSSATAAPPPPPPPPPEMPSYATLTPLQSLPPITSGVAMTGGGNYASLIGGGAAGDMGCDQGYSKMGGMGHALPPLSNRMLLNGFAAQTRGGQSQATAMDVVNHAAAAAAVASFSPYTKAAAQPVIGSNIISAGQAVASNPYDAGMFGSEVAAFQNTHHHHPMFSHAPHRTASAFVPQYQPPAFPSDLASTLHSQSSVSVSSAAAASAAGGMTIGGRRGGGRQSHHQKSHAGSDSGSIKQHKSSSSSGNSGGNAGSRDSNNSNSGGGGASGGGGNQVASIGCGELSDRSGSTQSIEEVNTKAVAAKVTAELKRYSIPQAVFAQKILHRSQGTLSDLLRNPKPWSKLKSGRETFRRMFKWLQIPEETRMPDLRLAGETFFHFFLQNFNRLPFKELSRCSRGCIAT
ncbi:MAG: hypothetical protein AAFP26_11480, partial [Planctomycetota bacterium]